MSALLNLQNWFSHLDSYGNLVDNIAIHDRLQQFIMTREINSYSWFRKHAADLLGRCVIHSDGRINERCLSYLLPFREDENRDVSFMVKKWLVNYDTSLTNLIAHMKNESKQGPILNRIFCSPFKQYEKINALGPYDEKIRNKILDRTVVQGIG